MAHYAEDHRSPQTWTPAPGGWPIPGQAESVVLRPGAGSAEYARYLRGYLPLFAALFVVVGLLGSIVFETAAADTGLVGGALLGLLAAGAMGGVLVAKVHRMLSRTVVVASSVGVELRDSLGCEIRLAWPDVVSIGKVTHRFSPQWRISEGGPGGLVLTAPEFTAGGLIGWGERVIPAAAPGFLRRRLAAQPRDPNTGKDLVAVAFAAAGPEGANNPLAQLARRHRPDLFG